MDKNFTDKIKEAIKNALVTPKGQFMKNTDVEPEVVAEKAKDKEGLMYALATNIAKYGTPQTPKGAKHTHLTKGQMTKKEKVVKDLKKALAEDAFDAPKKGRRFIPTTIPFPKNMRDEFKEHFKLVKSGEGDYKLYISPLMKTALEELQRGRTSMATLSKTSGLAKRISEKIPTSVRSILKNFSPKINPSIEMFPINSKIEAVKDGDIFFWNPSNPKTAGAAYDPIISENQEHYMFFQNLKTIKHAVEEMLKMDKTTIDMLLTNGHDWAEDHIATSKDDVEEVYHFLTDSNELAENQPTIAPTKPDIATEPEIKPKRRTLAPPTEAPDTKPKAMKEDENEVLKKIAYRFRKSTK